MPKRSTDKYHPFADVTHMTNQRLKVNDAAHYCGLSASTLNKYRVTGEGPVFRKLGRAVLYDTLDLDLWLESCKRRSTSDSV